MTYILPNYLIEEEPNSIISSDSISTFAYSSNRMQKKFSVRNTTHVMILLTQGQKKLTTKNEEILLSHGSILLLTQGNYFMSEILSDQGIYEAVLVYFDDTFAMDFISKYKVFLDKNRKKEVVSLNSNQLLKTLIEGYKLYRDCNVAEKNEIMKLKTEEIFLHLLDGHEKDFSAYLSAISTSSKDRIKYILEANVDVMDSIEEMCKLTRMSKNELRMATQKAFGLQPKAWLDSKRLEQASLLLQNSNETIASIASTCGYASLSWFGVQFKKMYGLTPKVYREQNL